MASRILCLASLDLSLQKERTLHEGVRLQFRFDVYNSLNHASFDLPGRIGLSVAS